MRIFKNKYLIRNLIIPFSIATLISLVLGNYIPWQGFFVNLAVTFFGFLLTISYVDIILEEHDRKRWKGVDKLIHEDIHSFINSTFSCVQTAFADDRFEKFSLLTQKIINHELSIQEISFKDLQTDFFITPKMVDNLNQEQWSELASGLQKSVDNANRLIDIFGHKLEPQVITQVFDVRNQIRKTLASHEIFYERLYVPENLSDTSRTIKKHINETVATDSMNLLEVLGKLFDKLDM